MTSLTEQLERLRRGSVDLIDEADLARKLARGPLTVKVGFDPSAPDIHLGHTVLLRKMRHFQDAGHRVVFVIGDFTGDDRRPLGQEDHPAAADPRGDRRPTRRPTRSRPSRSSTPEKTVIDFNDRWLGALGAAGFVRLAARVTVARILERDDFQKRWKAQQPIALHELLYPLAQGYDSVALKADVELGGTDQLFNLLVGRDLMRAEGLEPQVVMTLPLLVGTDGVEKMSKSLGNAIGVLDPPGDMFGKVMSIPDALLWSWYELLTDVPTAEIAARRARVEAGAGKPARRQGRRSARAIVGGLPRRRGRGRAPRRTSAAPSRGARSPTTSRRASSRAPTAAPAAKTLVALGLAASMREARRKIAEGALKVYAEGAAEPREVRDPEERLAAPGDATVLRLGRRFIRVAWKR